MSISKFIEKKLSSRGFKFKVKEINNIDSQSSNTEISILENDVQKFIINISGYTKIGLRKCNISLVLPIFNGNIYEMNGVKRAIIRKLRLNYAKLLVGRSYIIDDPSKILMDNINEIISSSLENFYHKGTVPPENIIQNSIDNFLKTDQVCQYIPDNKIAVRGIPEMITFGDLIENDLDVEKRSFPNELAGLVDYNSTSTGDRINFSYRMVKGTKTNSQKELIMNDQKNLFCSTIQDNAIGIQYNPGRVHLLRPQFEQSLEIVDSEIPYITGPNSVLNGMHFLTAIMNLSYGTYEDAILFSESAAARFRCIRKHKIRSNTSFNTEILVSIGSKVTAIDSLVNVSDVDDKITNMCCSKIQAIGTVTDIKRYHSSSYGRDTIKTVIEITEHCQLHPGDKITTRGGIKGVAVIFPDNKMPYIKDNDRDIPIDVCISPTSIYNRKSIVSLWEMALNNYCIKNKTQLVSIPFNEPIDFNDKILIEEGCHDLTQLYIKDRKLINKTYVNPLFIIRSDKIAHEILSCKDGEQRLNTNHLPVSGSKASGQRMDVSNRENINFKGLINIDKIMSERSPGKNHVCNLIKSIKND